MSARRELVLCSALAALASLLVLWAVPVGGDAPAHLYRTLLVQQGALVWDNLWFAGQYPLSSYSLLYYPLAALVGNAALGAAGIVLGAGLFASLLVREWGALGRWPARCFALLGVGQLFTGAYPYALGFAALLATIWALQHHQTWLAVVGATLTLGLSPLAFVILCIALLALFVRFRRIDARALVLGGTLVLLAVLQLGVLKLLPSNGLYNPYTFWRLLAGLAVAALGTALALRGAAQATLASLFVVWAAADLVSYFVRSPIGNNLMRPAALVFPIMLLTALLARFRPLWLAALAVSAALAANVVPYLTMIPDRSSDAGRTVSYWQPMLDYLASRNATGFRIEVVPTANHWESYYLPRAGYALARGWYRQLDIGDNPVLYRPITPDGYRRWLRSIGARYVFLTHHTAATVDARQEAGLIASGRAGLQRVFTDPTGSMYELRQATAVLSGPGPATITRLTHARVEGSVGHAGNYELRIHYTPYLHVQQGDVCLARAPGGMTRLRARRPGTFSLRAIEAPEDLIRALLDHDHPNCR